MQKSRFYRSNPLKTKGNVLFLILIAVMLFAALTAAITKSNQGGANMSKERGSINASDVMAYGATMEKTVTRMLSGDMSESALSFENPVWEYYNGDPVETASLFTNCTSDACKVFNPAGGGMTAQAFGEQSIASPAGTDVRSGHGMVYALAVSGVGTAEQDLVLMIAVIDRDTCMAINNSLKIANPGSNPPGDSWDGAVLYDGTFSSAADATGEIGDIATGIAGKFGGCIHRDGGAYGAQDNYFYQVLLPR